MCIYDLLHILLSVWHAYGSMECMYVSVYVNSVYLPYIWLWYGFHILKEQHGLVLLGEVGEKGVKNGSEGFLNFYWLLICVTWSDNG